MNRRRFSWLRLAVLLVLVGLLVGAWHNKQAIYDQIQLAGYTPSTTVSALASDTAMTDKARRIFYVNHPAIENSTSFNNNCANADEQTIVLGCYHGDQQGIFVYQVSDNRLQGVEQVTAAHEMLHAAYDRLSTKERNRVNGLLMNFYQNGLQDPRVKTTIDAYKRTEPNDVVNEMHSVFGTEVPNLPPELEAYYKQYFTDRSKVTAYAASYQQEFTSRENEVAQDDATLKQIKEQIDDNEANLTTKEQAIETARSKLNNERSSGDIGDYNAGVPGYNAEINSYNSLVTATQQLITQYNQLVDQRNAIALQVQDLQKAIDSRPSQISQ